MHLRFSRHIKLVHMGSAREFVCSFCPQRFSWMRSVREHELKIHNNENPDFQVRTVLQLKKDSVTSEVLLFVTLQIFRCEACDFKTYIELNLAKHKQRHDSNREKFTCDVCFKHYSTAPCVSTLKTLIHSSFISFLSMLRNVSFWQVFGEAPEVDA